MHDQVGVQHLLQRGAEGGDQLRRKVGDEPNRVRQNHLGIMRQVDRSHRRVQRREQHVPGHHVGPGQAVEQRRFARVGIANQRDDRIGHLGARGTVQFAGLHDLVQLTPQLGHLLIDGAAVGLDLRLARTAHKAKATALPFQVGPGAHQTGPLIGQRRQFDLQHAFAGGGPVGEDFEDQAGAVQQFDLPRLFQIALLYWRDGAVDQDQLDLVGLDPGAQFLDLALAEQHAGMRVGQAHDVSARHVQPRKGVGQRDAFVQ